jgi:hypothetical protein
MKKVHVLGDSHSLVFKYAGDHGISSKLDFVVCQVPGATAQGAINPNSKTDAFKIYSAYLHGTQTADDIIAIMLGEVDCGFVIWHYAEKFGIPIGDQLSRSLNNYRAFVRQVCFEKVPPHRVVFLGATLPSVDDNDNPDLLMGARKSVTASLAKRTELTLEYNSRLMALALAMGAAYRDITKETIEPATGLLNPAYRQVGRVDHHLCKHQTAPMWVRKIEEFYEKTSRP